MPRTRALKSSPTGSGEAISRLGILQKLRMVIRAAAQHSSWIEKQCGVNGAQLWIMQELSESGGVRIGALADLLAIHQTTASNLVDGLVKRGYAAKLRDTVDQRVVMVRLTASGAALLAAAPKPARGLLPEALLQLDEASLAQLDAGLQGLIDSIATLDEELGMLPMPFTMGQE